MRPEKVSVDRGVQLDQMRLRGDFVDVHFIVEGQRFPAHRFIVGLHSPVLRMLTVDKNANTKINGDDEISGPVFIDCGQAEIEMKGMSSKSFDTLLTYLYTGSMNLTEFNVFQMVEICQFLQIEDKLLIETCEKFLTKLIEDVSLNDVNSLLKVWCLAEQYEWSGLKQSVLKLIDRRLETFLSHDLFSFLGYEEIKSILSRPTLCVRSEKLIFDSLVDWLRVKVSDDDPESQSLALDLIGQLSLDLLKSNYLMTSLSDVICDRSEIKCRSTKLKACQDCFYLTVYSRSENEIRGIKEFLDQRKSELEFTSLVLKPGDAAPTWNPLSNLTKPKTYFQHYGPHEGVRGANFLTTDLELYLFGCQKSSVDATSNEIKIFSYVLQSWARTTATMPKRLKDFGIILIGSEIFLVGGITDGFYGASPSKDQTRSVRSSRTFQVSIEVFKTRVDDLRDTTTKTFKNVQWVRLQDLPSERTGFSLASVDSNRIFVVGNDFCDVLDVNLNTWLSIKVPFSSEKDVHGAAAKEDGLMKPVLASLGSNIYLFGHRPVGSGVNSAWVLDTHTLTWAKVIPSLEIRYDPKGAFSHNGLVYLLGWQAASNNFVYTFDPKLKKWSLVVKNEGGHFATNGILVRKSYFSSLDL